MKWGKWCVRAVKVEGETRGKRGNESGSRRRRGEKSK